MKKLSPSTMTMPEAVEFVLSGTLLIACMSPTVVGKGEARSAARTMLGYLGVDTNHGG